MVILLNSYWSEWVYLPGQVGVRFNSTSTSVQRQGYCSTVKEQQYNWAKQIVIKKCQKKRCPYYLFSDIIWYENKWVNYGISVVFPHTSFQTCPRVSQRSRAIPSIIHVQGRPLAILLMSSLFVKIEISFAKLLRSSSIWEKSWGRLLFERKIEVVFLLFSA